jgi:hypothetical protein
MDAAYLLLLALLVAASYGYLVLCDRLRERP